MVWLRLQPVRQRQEECTVGLVRGEDVELFSDGVEEVGDPDQRSVRVGVAEADRNVPGAEPAERDKVRDDAGVRVELAELGIHGHRIDLLDGLTALLGVEVDVGLELSVDEGRVVELVEEVLLAGAGDVASALSLSEDAKVDEVLHLVANSDASGLGDRTRDERAEGGVVAGVTRGKRVKVGLNVRGLKEIHCVRIGGTVPLSSERMDPFLSPRKRIGPLNEKGRDGTMPRNTTGGSKHKSQSNSESSKARNNRTIIDDLLDDYRDGSNTDGVFVGRVLRRMGCGRMEVFYVKKEFNEFEGEHGTECTQIIPMRGGLRGRGKKDVWVEPGCLVVLSETGLGQTTHEIVAVFSAPQIARLRKLKPDMNPRFFAEEPGMSKEDEGGIVIEDYASEDEVDVEDI